MVGRLTSWLPTVHNAAVAIPTRTSQAGGITSAYPMQLALAGTCAVLVVIGSALLGHLLTGLAFVIPSIALLMALARIVRLLRAPGSVCFDGSTVVVQSPLLPAELRIPLDNVRGAWDENVRSLRLDYSSPRVVCLFVGLGIDRRWTVALREPVELRSIPFPAQLMHWWWSCRQFVPTTPFSGQHVSWISVRLPESTPDGALPELGDTVELQGLNANA